MAENHISMSNQEAADILEICFMRFTSVARRNGKSMLQLKVNEAILKAIAVLRNTPDK